MGTWEFWPVLPGKTWFQSTVGFGACICCPGKQVMPIPLEIVTKWQSDWKYGMPKWTCLQGLIFNNRKWKSREAGWRWKICIKSRFLRVSEQCVSPGALNKRGTALQKLLSWAYWLRVQHSACQLHLPVFIYCLHCGNPPNLHMLLGHCNTWGWVTMEEGTPKVHPMGEFSLS